MLNFDTVPSHDPMDDQVNRAFAGKVVRKDLVRKIKSGANVPVFVLEYLLGKYCASSDEMAIKMGLQVVKDILANNYIRPDEATKAQSRVKEAGRYTFIDKVRVRLVDSDYWASAINFGHNYLHIPSQYVRDYERLLTGGIWAQIEMRFEYDQETRGKYPFWIDRLTPIQLASFSLEGYRTGRAQFSSEEWIDFIIRSMGYESGQLDRRTKLLFLTRLIPLCEQNFNLIELGPRGTGKSYVVQEISPYAALLTGPTAVANLFGHMTGRQKGMVQTGHLFAPLPDVIRNDMAFIDRLHFYLPGWEIPKMHNNLLTDHYGFVVDYLAEALRELRKHNFTEAADRCFTMGSHLNTRDRKAVRRTISGLMKIVYPHGETSREELQEIVELAIEGRRRVKEQLKKMGSFEYYQTSFSYTDAEHGQEYFVGVPEQGGRDLISADPLAPGTAYTASVSADGTVGLYRLEVTLAAGTGKLRFAGGVSGAIKESLSRSFSYLNANKVVLGLGQEFDVADFHVEVIDLLNNRQECEIGVALFVACFSALRRPTALAALLVVGDMSVQGNIKPLHSLTEPLQVAMDNGARRALIPIANKRSFMEVSTDIMEHVDPIFYGDPKIAVFKALGLT